MKSLFFWLGDRVTADSSAVCDRFVKQGRALVVNNGSELPDRQTHCRTEVWVKFNNGYDQFDSILKSDSDTCVPFV